MQVQAEVRTSAGKMSHYFTFAVLAFASFTVVNCQVQLPCDHPLHNVPLLSRFFEHYQCQYGDWSDLVPQPGALPVPVSHSDCESGIRALGVQYQYAQSCNDPGCNACPVK